jgi:hypothetical protein
MNCESVFVDSDSDVGIPCGRTAIATCSDCGTAICEDCCVECCGQPFCGVCYGFHATSSCLRKPVQAERYTVRELPDKTG